MARQSIHNDRPRARAKAWIPQADVARRPAGLLLPDGIANAAGWLHGLRSDWMAAEVAPGRLMPWIPVAFGFGIVAPSFQMSFAATLALIAVYQHGLPLRADTDSSLGMRVALWGAREVAGLLLASLVAGFATTPYDVRRDRLHRQAWRRPHRVNGAGDRGFL